MKIRDILTTAHAGDPLAAAQELGRLFAHEQIGPQCAARVATEIGRCKGAGGVRYTEPAVMDAFDAGMLEGLKAQGVPVPRLRQGTLRL